MMIQIEGDKIDEANEALRSLQCVAELLLNMERQDSLHNVHPENLCTLLWMIAEKLDTALKV